MSLPLESFKAIAAARCDNRCELYEGELREKAPTSVGHNLAVRRLGHQLWVRLGEAAYEIAEQTGYLATPDGDAFVPDLMLIPNALTDALMVDPKQLEIYTEPLPLVVEVVDRLQAPPNLTDPALDAVDADAKIPGYQRRGDAEIWRIDPFARIVTTWRRQLNGAYVESERITGALPLHALPGVTIDLDALFR